MQDVVVTIQNLSPAPGVSGGDNLVKLNKYLIEQSKNIKKSVNLIDQVPSSSSLAPGAERSCITSRLRASGGGPGVAASRSHAGRDVHAVSVEKEAREGCTAADILSPFQQRESRF
jgi:hypothetical protein